MSAIKGRKQRRGINVVDCKRLVSDVPVDVKLRIDAVAARLGISTNALLASMVEREIATLDEQGRPAWWTAPEQEELPLKTAS